MPLLTQIRKLLAAAKKRKKKVAALHSLALIHAVAIKEVGPVEFCRAVGLPATYHIEVRKMIAAAEFLPELGYTLVSIR